MAAPLIIGVLRTQNCSSPSLALRSRPQQAPMALATSDTPIILSTLRQAQGERFRYLAVAVWICCRTCVCQYLLIRIQMLGYWALIRYVQALHGSDRYL